MRLRTKILVAISATAIVATALLAFFFTRIVLKHFTELETEYTRENVTQMVDTINDALNNQLTKTTDWAIWDDAEKFLRDGNKEFIKSNLQPNSLIELKINFIYYIKNSGQILSAVAVDLEKEEMVPITELMTESILGILAQLDSMEMEKGGKGLTVLADQITFITSHPVLPSSGEGSSPGIVVFGRFLDQDEANRLQTITNTDVEFLRLDHPMMPSDTEVARLLRGSKQEILLKPLNRWMIAGYTILNDFAGKPIVMLRVDLIRNIYERGLMSLKYLVGGLVIGLIVMLVMIFILFDRLIIARFHQLSESMHEIGVKGNLSGRLPSLGADEVGTLAVHINDMLEKLEKTQGALSFEREQLISIFEGIDEAIYVADPNSYEILYANQVFKNMFSGEIIGKQCFQVLHDFKEPCSFCTNHLILGENIGQPYVWDFYYPRQGRWYHCIDRAVKWPDGRWVRQEIAIDITERKLHEEHLQFISQRDAATGLYNQGYFQARMCAVSLPPAGIIVCDVDGLKLVNDTLGHDAGDRLLKATATIIQRCFRETDVVARIGGDEFAVLLPNLHPIAKIEDAADRIRQSLADYNAANPEFPVSVSVGFAATEQMPIDLNELFKQADNNMYHQKQTQSKIARHRLVASLLETMENRGFFDLEHTDRLAEYAVALAQAVGYPSNHLADLRLLARYHDIGKIGILETILNKTVSLSESEKEFMKRHSEIGWRIAQSSPDSAAVADQILQHHEWWNGQGYPAGKSGEDIPLACRIFTVADAYDAMLSDRPYRQAMTQEQALQELTRCSGSQFEPRLVEAFLKLMRP
ncbi:MAG: diguanylate cyclase [Myxococcales bacterium]|nr:diguanylate cyclase [Myxococcales bacterium]